MKNDKSNNFIVIAIVMFVFNLCYSMLIPVLPVYFGEKGLSVLVVSFLFSIYAVSRAIIQIPMGLLIDNVDKSKLLKFLFLSLAIIFSLYIILKNIVSLYLLRAIEGIIAGITSPLIYSLLSLNISDENNGVYIGYFTTVSSLGLAMGPFITGVLQNNTFISEEFFITAAVGSLLSIAIMNFNYKKQEELYINIHDGNENTKFKSIIKTFIKERNSIISIGLVAFFGDFIFGIISLILPLYFADNYPNSIGYAAYLLSFNFFIFTILSPVNGKLVDKFGHIKIMKISLIMVSLSFVFAFFSSTLILFFMAIICEAIFGSMLFCANQVNAMKLGRKINSTGKVFAIIGTFQSIGTAVGPLLAGYIYSINSKYVFLMLSFVGVAFFLITNLIFLKKKDEAMVN